MARLRRNRVIYAKIESTYGTDASPTGAEAVATKNFSMSEPYAGDRVTRDLDRPDLGLDAEINVNPYVSLSFDVEVAGSGTAATPPAYGPLLKACGFSETITTEVTYDPVSTFTDSVTIYAVIDGTLHVCTGARGSVSFNFQKGIPHMSFTFNALYATPVTDSVPLTPDFSAYQDPLPMTDANTTFAIGAYSAILNSMSADMGLNLFPRNVPGQEEILQTDRGVTGTIVIDAPAVADKDIFSDLVESHTGINTDTMQLVHGTVAGNIVQIDAPKIQLSSVSEGDDNGLLNYSMSARFLPSTGDDEFVLTTK